VILVVQLNWTHHSLLYKFVAVRIVWEAVEDTEAETQWGTIRVLTVFVMFRGRCYRQKKGEAGFFCE